MGFFQDLKEDLSQAVNELMPDEALQEAEEIQSQEREEVKKEVSGKKEAQKEEASEIVIDPAELDALLKDEGEGNKEEYSPDMVADVEAALKEAEEFDVDFQKDFQEESGNLEDDFEEEDGLEDDFEEQPAKSSSGMEEEFMEENSNLEDDFEEIEEIEENNIVEEKLPETPVYEEKEEQVFMQPIQEEVQSEKNVEEQESKGDRKMAETTKLTGVASDETSIITEGMTITGDISSKGSLEILGTINGNVETLGKMDVAGSINGDSKAAEIYADSANINGEVRSEGVIKIGQSSVIIGNIFATSAAIAGAVKGDIDVKGPVILDTTAIVMGNIKSKSVQINNGAVIEGLCSQCYADVNPTAFFEDLKKK